MPNHEFQARVLARLDEQVSNFRRTGDTPFEQRVRVRQMAEQMPEEERAGFFERLNNLFVDPDFLAAQQGGASFMEAARANQEAGGFSPKDVAQMGVLGAGIVDPIIGGAQAIAQIPGLFTSVELPTDRAAQYLERLRLGLTSRAEEAAITAGIDPVSLADAHLMGEMVGFTVPVVASLKAAGLATGIRGSALTPQRNFMLDTAAGLIYGSTLLPEEELSQRGINTLRESALFGVGGLMINGLIMAAAGMKFARANQLTGRAELSEQLNRIANGERVVLKEEGFDLMQLMSEEGFLASSPEAYAILETGAFDATLIQAIQGTAEAGVSRGFARSLGNTFAEASEAIGRFKEQFPQLKFDAIKNRTTGQFDIHFGMTGLNNQQKAQLAREGRFAGQMIQKNDAAYLYVREGKGGRLVVRTVDGRTTSLSPSGVTDLPQAVEDIPLPTAGAALYEDFRAFTFGKIRAAAEVTGELSETDIVRFIRQDQLGMTDDAVRSFEAPGAITYPSEVGLPGATVEEFTEAYLREGAHGYGLLQPEPIRRFDDAFDAWLTSRNLSPTSTDALAFRQNFAQQMRRDIWALVPEVDMADMRRIQAETFRLIDAEELPFDVLAGAKGFHVERSAIGEITLRDINTGARLTFATEEVAENSLRAVARNEKDSLSDFFSPGPHGGSAFTTGFDVSDGVFTFGTHVAPDEMFKFLPTQSITNRRDFLIAMEDVSDVPMFTEGFAKVDEGLLRMQNRLAPISERISRIWKGLNRRKRKQVAEFWTNIEGTDLSGIRLTRAARAAGLDNKQITALNAARTLFDFGAEQIGLPESRFISNYYSRVRPAMLKDGRFDPARLLADDPIARKEYEFWAEMSRTGELSQVELDPEIVMHKYFRSLMYKQEVSPFEGNVRRMMNLRIRELSPTQQTVILQRSMPGTTPESFIYPQEVRGMLQEYLNNIRGDSRPGFASARRFGVRMFSSVGIDLDPRVIDEFYNTLLALPYGAALGLRAVLMNRNATQNLWMMYTRVGGKFGSDSLARALTQTGYDEALAAGAIRDITAALPEADAIFNTWFGKDIARGSGPLSHAASAVIRRAVRLGRISRATAQKFLVPYGSGDQVNRAWAYQWQRMHTADWLAKFDSKAISWDDFLDDGLPFFSSSIKRGFEDRMKRFGREPALQWIGKQASDEAHFIYGAGASPTWMQTTYGKLFGVFGQWPLWAKQLYFNRMSNATPKQIGQFWARTAAVTGAFANMSMQSGVSMMNWIAPASLGFSGGPAVDMAIQAREIWSGPLDQKASAINRLGQQVGSLALPGQLFYSEFTDALSETDPSQAILRLTLGRSADVGNFNYDFILDPSQPSLSDIEPEQGPLITGLPPIEGLNR